MLRPINQALVIFGASGDLTYRKLLPALFDLYSQSALPENFVILGVARSPMTRAAFCDKMKEGIEKFSNLAKKYESLIEPFLSRVDYLSIDTFDKAEYSKLRQKLVEIDHAFHTDGNYLFYLATPPSMYEIVAFNLQAVDLHREQTGRYFRRIIVEKPFGYDLASALDLNNKLHAVFSEQQIYRIDHYLGKETVQNILVFRFSNGLFEPIWNRNFIHHVEITAAETLGIGNRGRYYEQAGAIRDMLQNHLMHLLALVAMEPPVLFEAQALQNEMVKVLQALRPLDKESIESNIIRGQYTGARTNRGFLAAYREEKDVAPDSNTETFVAMKVFIDNWRWADVPFYIRTGKRLPSQLTEVIIHLKATPQSLFKGQCTGPSCNKIILRIQPEEGIGMQFGLKSPGSGYNVKQVQMDFKYSELANIYIPSAYERLLLDVMQGDPALFIRGDAVEATWKFIDPLLKYIQSNKDFKLYGYPSCTWGPEEANQLIPEGWSEYPAYCSIEEEPRFTILG